MRPPTKRQAALLSLYPPTHKDGSMTEAQVRDLRLVGLCYHHANLRARLGAGQLVERSERLFLLHLEHLSPMRSPEDRRWHRRHPVLLAAELQMAGKVTSAQVVNICAGGLGVTSRELPPVGTKMQVVLGGGSQVLVATCALRWRRLSPGRYHGGLEILLAPARSLPDLLGRRPRGGRMPWPLPSNGHG